MTNSILKEGVTSPAYGKGLLEYLFISIQQFTSAP